jgi:hypothetical protein
MGARNQEEIGLAYRPASACLCKPFKELRNRFPAWRAGTPALFVVPDRQATQAGGIDYYALIPGLHNINIYKYGLRLHRLAESIPGLPKNTVSAV